MRILATLFVLLFANQASADKQTQIYIGYKAELIMMYGGVLKSSSQYSHFGDVALLINLMPDAYEKMRAEQMP